MMLLPSHTAVVQSRDTEERQLGSKTNSKNKQGVLPRM